MPSPHNKQPESASELINVLSDESHTHDLFKVLLLQSDMGRDAARKVAAIDRDKEQIDTFKQDAEHQRQCHELSNAVALEQTERLAIIEADERNMKSIADTESAVRESLRRRLLPSVLTSNMLRERPTTGHNARGFDKDESVLLEAVAAREADPDEETIRKLTGEREQLQAQIQETSIIETRRPLVEKATRA